MKRIPRDISGQELIKALQLLGYNITRQVGSHIRLSTLEKGEHHITSKSQSDQDWDTFQYPK